MLVVVVECGLSWLCCLWRAGVALYFIHFIRFFSSVLSVIETST